MNVIMAGIDYSMAGIDIRERFSFTKTTLDAAYKNILECDDINGVVILSTCNRTEIYLSCKQDFYVNPFVILCQEANVDFKSYADLHSVRSGEAVIKHLCELACGIKSQIWGEDQIITQVKTAIAVSRELKAADGTLEVLFRNAISAAKKVKTTVRLEKRESSVVYIALDALKSRDNIKDVLVIGNGEIGRLMTEVLIENWYHATMTLRQYKHAQNIIPYHAEIIEYSKRYEKIAECDAVISATLSPHHTIEAAPVGEMERYPVLFLDLAVPRDIDPQIANLAGVELFDIDTLCADSISEAQAKQLIEVEKITSKYSKDYQKWCEYKERLVRV